MSMLDREVMVEAGRIKGKRIVITEPLIPGNDKPLKRTVFRSETETFIPKSPAAVRLGMTGVLP